MKFGIIGFGRMGQLYKEILNSLNIKLDFICDVQKQDGISNFYTDYCEALNKTDVDGIIVSTYGPSHNEIIELAINNNVKYIACEKPFTTSVKDADNILKLLKKSNSRLNINYLRRFSEPYRKLFDEIHNKQIIGKPKSIIISSGAGGISALGTHFIDLSRYLLASEVSSVYGISVDKNLPNPRGDKFKDPGGYAILNFKNNSRMFLDMGDDLGIQPRIEILGEYGRIIINELNNKLEVYSRSKEDMLKKKHFYVLPNPILRNDLFNFESISTLTKKMIKNLISNDSIISPASSARNNVEIYSSLRNSFDTSKVVNLPLNDLYCKKEFMVT
jgi:predicted dehydrogenase